MKIYLIERLDKVDYDEYYSFVVRAGSEDQALELVSGKFEADVTRADLKVTEVKEEGEVEIILGSFNAG